jgi:hypothetical protein
MYNNIKNFINPQYATLFLICIISLLTIIFVKSRRSVETFVGNDLKEIRNIKGDIKDLESDVKKNARSANDNIQSLSSRITSANSGIFNLNNTKLDTKDFGNTLANNKKFQRKLDTSDFDSTLANSSKFNDKLNTSDFENTLDNSRMFQTKLNIKDFSKTLSNDETVVKLQNDLKSVPTMNNISQVINTEVQSKVGDIESAKNNLDTAYKSYDICLNIAYGNYQSNLSRNAYNHQNTLYGSFEKYNSTLGNTFTSSFNAFNTNADIKTGLLDSKWDYVGTEMNRMQRGAETAAIAAIDAKSAAEEAKFKTQKMYDDVFKEASARVVTQANDYRNGLQMNSTTGYYDPSGMGFFDPSGIGFFAIPAKEGFGPFDSVDGSYNDMYDVIQDLNAFNTAYYAWISCKSGKCPTGKTADQLRADVVTASTQLSTTIDTLKAKYPTNMGSDQTQDIVDRAQRIDQLRRDLDTKMEAILKSKTRTDEPAIQYDSTVYAGILWSILGTSMLYYVFTEL